jgi:hypothetical protein
MANNSDWDALDHSIGNVTRVLLQKQALSAAEKRQQANDALRQKTLELQSQSRNQAAGQKVYDASIKESDKDRAAREKIIREGADPAGMKQTVEEGKGDVAAAKAEVDEALKSIGMEQKANAGQFAHVKTSLQDETSGAVYEWNGHPDALERWKQTYMEANPQAKLVPHTKPAKDDTYSFSFSNKIIDPKSKEQLGEMRGSMRGVDVPKWLDTQNNVMALMRKKGMLPNDASQSAGTSGVAPVAGGPALPGGPVGGQTTIPAGPAAPAQPKALDRATAAQILQEAGGDKNKARLLAQQRGFSF